MRRRLDRRDFAVDIENLVDEASSTRRAKARQFVPSRPEDYEVPITEPTDEYDEGQEVTEEID